MWMQKWKYLITEAIPRRCSLKKVFLETQNSQESTGAGVSF